MHRIDASEPTLTPDTDHSADRRVRRAGWRQRLVQAERGFACSLRADSTLFGHFFAWIVIIVVGMVLRLHWQQWIVIGLCLAFALSAELFHQAFRTLVIDPERKSTSREMRALGLAAAATVVAMLGAATPIVTIFWQRLQHLL